MLVIVDNVTFSYDSNGRSMDSLSLKVCAGEVLGLAGHNGAGKTTFLKILSGLLVCQSGEIKYEFINKRGNNISYVPDQGGFYEEMSGIDNLVFRCELAGLPDGEGKARKMLNAVGLEKQSGGKVKTYSHGMKKRLAIACACITRPALLLLDESLNGVDPESRDKIVKLLQQMKQEGAGIVISTHDLELMGDLCDRVAILQAGSLLFEGEIAEIDGDVRRLYRKLVIEDGE